MAPEDELVVIKPSIVTVSIRPVIAAGIYTTGDALGARFGLPNVVDKAGGGAILESIVVLDQDDEGIQIDFPLFSKTFTATADHDEFAVTDDDLQHCIGHVSISNYANFCWAVTRVVVLPCSFQPVVFVSKPPLVTRLVVASQRP